MFHVKLFKKRSGSHVSRETPVNKNKKVPRETYKKSISVCFTWNILQRLFLNGAKPTRELSRGFVFLANLDQGSLFGFIHQV